MKAIVKAIADDRKPLERRRAVLLAELAVIDSMLDEIGKPCARRAALRYIADHPGVTTPEIVAASGVVATDLSRLMARGVLRNEGQRGRGGRGKLSRWWLAAQAPRKADEP